MSKIPPTEAEMVELLQRHATDIFVHIHRVATEVRSHGRASTDMVVVTGDDWLIAIEAKQTDWQKAISQAFLNRCCADRSYIALWSTKIRPEVLAGAEEFGLGVLSVGCSSIEIALDAPPCEPDHLMRAIVRGRLEDRLSEAERCSIS